jgi:dihydropteroate synthase
MKKRKTYVIHARDHRLTLGFATRIMGIINVTPDSFSQDGCLCEQPDRTKHRALRLAKKLLREGADILDIGGESSRPMAPPVTAKEEIARVVPVIRALTQKGNVPISVDTYKTTVAREALKAGASIVNTIKGNQVDKGLLKVVKEYDAAIILMHMRGTPLTMQKKIHYQDVTRDICQELKNSIEKCLEIGIKSNRIIIDPGIGFGKTVDHNLRIINRLSDFLSLNQPLLVGTSRKSFIGNILDKDVNHRVMGTGASVAASIIRGAHIIRVHDVKPMNDVCRITDSILNEQPIN